MPFFAIDLETTGLEPGRDRVIEIAAVRFDRSGRVLACFERLVRLDGPLPEAARGVHGITEEELELASTPEEALNDLFEFLPPSPDARCLAHNACVDAAFLGAELRRASLPIPRRYVIDTLALARRRHPEFRKHSLEALAERLGLEGRVFHRALSDALCLSQLWLALGGPEVPAEQLVAYPIHDPGPGVPAPRGWEALEEAIAAGRAVTMVHEGRRRGRQTRLVTPRGFLQKGGDPYLLADCHQSGKAKAFRLDRIREVRPAAEGPGDQRVDRARPSR